MSEYSRAAIFSQFSHSSALNLIYISGDKKITQYKKQQKILNYLEDVQEELLIALLVY